MSYMSHTPKDIRHEKIGYTKRKKHWFEKPTRSYAIQQQILDSRYLTVWIIVIIMVKTWRKRLFGAFMVKMCECAKLGCVNMEWISVCNHHFCGVANIENTLTAGYHWMRNARILISAGKLMRRQQLTLFLRRHNVISHFYNHTWIRAERFEKVGIAHNSFNRLTEWDFLSKWQIEHKHSKHKNISEKHFRTNKFDFCRTEFHDRSSAKEEKTENSAKSGRNLK